jgi:photosystem II stability/assembly factor-like uncharacterized protein
MELARNIRVLFMTRRQGTTVLAAVLWLALSPWPASPAAAQSQPPPDPATAVIAPLASRSLLLDAASIDGRLVVVGERGHVLVSDDGGASWNQAQVPTIATLTAVHFHDRNLGWAVGHDAVILRSRDGGATWQLLFQDPEQERPFLDVWFADAEHGFAVGAYGLFAETSDGGETWEERTISDSDYHLHHISRSDTGKLYIAAEAGTVYRSDDGGDTWLELASPYKGSFFSTLPLDGDALLLAGLRGHLFRSDDAGESWQAIETGTEAMLTDAIRLRDGSPLVVGLEGMMLTSTDGGRSVSMHPRRDRFGISSVVEIDGERLLVVGSRGLATQPVDELTAGGPGGPEGTGVR